MSFWSLFSTLPEPIQTVLLGGAGDFLGGIASDIVTRLVDKLGYRVRQRFLLDPKQVALNQAMAQALYETFGKLTNDPELFTHYLNIFTKWIERDEVAGELSQLIDPRPEAQLDLQLLIAEFEELGYDPDFLGEGLEFEEVIREFAKSFYSAAAEQEELRGVIEISLLRGVVEKLGEITHISRRTAIATESIATDVEDIKAITQGLLDGVMTANDIHKTIRKAVKHGFANQHRLLEIIAATLQKAGYDVAFNQEGAAEIDGERSVAGTKIEPTVLRQLQQEITLLRQAIVGHSPTDEELGALEGQYRHHIIQWFEHLTFQGMMSTARVISLPLEDVYVELRAVAEVPEVADTFSVEERRLLIDLDSKDESGKKDLLRQLDALRRERWSRVIPERKSIGDAIRDSTQNAIVILGDPGSGKTTLLHLLALLYARGSVSVGKVLGHLPKVPNQLPIFIPLAAFDDILRQKPKLTLLEFLPLYYERRRMLPGLETLFYRALQTGRALLLFDGLDEVLDATARKYISQQVTALINQFEGQGVQFVISSRFVGYREAPLPGKLPHLSVMDFGEPEIETFAHQWTHALEKALAGSIETSETIRRARKLEIDLLNDVKSNPGVRRLAANPLMLTMLALMRRQVGRLPHRRTILYERYINTLIESWIENRTLGERTEAVEVLELHEVESILIPLALWLQQTKPSGTATYRELHSALKKIYLEKAGVQFHGTSSLQLEIADKQARRFLKEMRQMTGLIIERGHDAYGFLHLTFQEYFVGRALAQLEDQTRWEISKLYLHDSRWRESILLCCGRLGVVENRQKQVTEFVHQILSSPDETEPELHRKLLLALAIASDDVNLSQAIFIELGERVQECFPTFIYELARQLIREVGKIAANGSIEFIEVMAPALNADNWGFQTVLCEVLSDFLHVSGVIEILTERLDHGSSDVRKSAIRALASIANSNDQVLHLILRRLSFDVSVRDTAIKVLAKYVETNNAIRNTVLSYLPLDSSYITGDVIVDAAAPLIASDPKVRRILLERFEFDDTSAPQAMIEIVAENVEVRNQVFSLVNSKSKNVRKSVIMSLAKVVDADSEARSLAIAALDDVHEDVRRAAIETLTNLVVADTEVRNRIASLLNDKSSTVAWSVLRALQKVVYSDDAIREKVVSCLFHEDNFMRATAVETLTEMMRSNEEVRTIIISCLDDDSAFVQQVATKALSNIIDQERVQITIQSLPYADSWEVRQEVAQALGNSLSNMSSYKWLNGSLARLETSRDLFLEGLGILSNLVLANLEVRQFVIEGLISRRVEVRSKAIEILARCMDKDASLLELITASLKETNSDTKELRYHLSAYKNDALGLLIEADTDIRNIALSWLHDEDSILNTYAILAFARQIETNNEARSLVISTLKLDQGKNLHLFWVIESLSEVLTRDDELRNLITESIFKRIEDDRLFLSESSIKVIGRFIEKDSELYERMISIVVEKESRKKRNVKMTAALILTELIEHNEEIQGLFKSLVKDNNGRLRSYIVDGLSRLVESDDELRRLFIEMLDNWDEGVRRSAVKGLSRLVASDQEVTDGFLLLLKNEDEETDIREMALLALSFRLPFDETVKQLIATCINDRWIRIRIVAIETLSALVETDEEIRNKVIEQLYSSWWGTRGAAVGALLHWSQLPTSPLWYSIVNWLRADIKDQYYGWLKQDRWADVIEMLSKTVGIYLPTDKVLQERIIGWLNEPSFSVRLGAIRALASCPGGPSTKITAQIINGLKDQRGLESYPARLTAASSLINHRNSMFSQNAIEVCLEALTYGTAPWDNLEDSGKVRKQAVLVLSKLEPIYYDARVYQALSDAMFQDEDSEVRDAAYGALVRLVGAKEIELVRELRIPIWQ